MSRNQSKLISAATISFGILTFALARWAVAGHRHMSSWVVAGRNFVVNQHWLLWAKDPTGYDGQFYWRLAADPFHLQQSSVLGVHLDHLFRINRIAYPLLAWAVSFGQPALVSYSLVVVNALALLGIFLIARRRETDVLVDAQLFPLTMLLIPGLVGAFSRDLTEVLLALGLVLFLRAIDNSKWAFAGLGLTLAVLTKESALIFVAAMFVYVVVQQLLQRKVIWPVHLAWFLPIASEAIWQGIAKLATGTFPLVASGSTHDLGLPLVGIARGASTWFHGGLHADARSVLYVAQLLAFLVPLGTLTWLWKKLSARQIVFLVVAAALVLCESKKGWVSPFDLRYGVPAMVFMWWELPTVCPPNQYKRIVWFVGAVTLLTVAWRIVVI